MEVPRVANIGSRLRGVRCPGYSSGEDGACVCGALNFRASRGAKTLVVRESADAAILGRQVAPTPTRKFGHVRASDLGSLDRLLGGIAEGRGPQSSGLAR